MIIRFLFSVIVMISLSHTSYAQTDQSRKRDIVDFYKNYNRVIQSCEMTDILQFFKTHYWDQYQADLTFKDTPTVNVSYQRFAADLAYKIVTESKTPQKCQSDIKIKKINILDDHAIVQILHTEKTMLGGNARMPSMNFLCNHYIDNNNNQTLTILKSACSVY